MRNKQWTFPMKGNTDIDIVDYFGSEGTKQHALPDWLGQAPGAAIMALGSVKMNTANDDNNPTSKVNMTNYLAVSVNGNGIDNDENKTYPSMADIQKIYRMPSILVTRQGAFFRRQTRKPPTI